MTGRHVLVSVIAIVAMLFSTPASARRRSAASPSTPFNELHSEGGYANLTSVEPGQPIRFHIATRVTPFNVTIVNLADQNIILQIIPALSSRAQNCSGYFQSGCKWDVTTTFGIPFFWQSGYYAASFPTSFGTRRIIFVVRAAQRGGTSRILIVSPTHTYHAYNTFGGNSLYPSNSNKRASLVSYDRPYEQDSGLGRFDFWERKFVDWMERDHRPYEVATDLDLEDPTLLANYNVVVLAGHSEYWTATARKNLEAFSERGGHIAIFGGNTMWWQIRLENNNRTIVAYKEAILDPLISSDGSRATIHWFEEPVNNPENLIIGASFRHGGYANAVIPTTTEENDDYELVPPEQRIGFTVRKPEHWVFIGTNVMKGSTFGRDAVGIEVDGVLYNCDANGDVIRPDGSDGTPLNYQILATTPASNGHGTMGIYVNMNGGGVFNAATQNWVAALASDVVVARITSNVLDMFQDGRRLIYDQQTTTTLTEDRFNCTQKLPTILPGWRGTNRGSASVSSRCAYEGAGGLELTGGEAISLARPFTAKGESRSQIELRFYVNVDAFERRTQLPAPVITLENRKGAQASQVALVEVDLKDGKRLLRLARRGPDGFVPSAWIELASGWHLVEVSWRSPGSLVIQVDGGAPQTLDNPHAGQLVNELIVEYPRAEMTDAGRVCIDAVAAGTAKSGGVAALVSLDR